jgi:hypothetical protein
MTSGLELIIISNETYKRPVDCWEYVAEDGSGVFEMNLCLEGSIETKFW